jgi:signal transduction histidine kinase
MTGTPSSDAAPRGLRLAAAAPVMRYAQMQGHAGPCWAVDVSCVPRAAICAGETAQAAGNVLPHTIILEVNEPAAHTLGPYSGRAGMIGRPISAFWPRESQAILSGLIQDVLSDGSPGAERSQTITSLQFQDPRLSVWTGQGSDVEDIVFIAIAGTEIDGRSLWSLRASEVRYRNLIQHLPSALLEIDATAMTAMFDRLRADGIADIAAHLDATPEAALTARRIVRVTDANRAAVQLLGATGADQLIGPVDYLFAASPDTAKRVIAAHYDGRRNFSDVMKLATLDGRLRDVALTVTYPTPPDRLDITILGLEDITERLRTEAQLRQLQADYSRAARISTLGELATSIAHEINQPLAAIVTNAETSQRWIARDEPNLAKVAQLTARIAESGRRASDIVQRIRQMAARRPPERAPIDLSEVVDEALHFVRHEIESRSINLSARLAPDLPLVLGDRVQLQQVIVNLLVNAVQAQGCGPDTRIDLATAAGAADVRFTIHDGGSGIAPEDLGRIFSSFFTTKEEGIGIGLALCQSIIASHGGTISAANHPDGGALFQFMLPVAPQE